MLRCWERERERDFGDSLIFLIFFKIVQFFSFLFTRLIVTLKRSSFMPILEQTDSAVVNMATPALFGAV